MNGHLRRCQSALRAHVRHSTLRAQGLLPPCVWPSLNRLHHPKDKDGRGGRLGSDMLVRVKRVYEAPSRSDGTRILVDRLWPRGVTKEQARVDLWLKEIAPSAELRQWFNHEPEKRNEFKRRYVAELRQRPEVVARLVEAVRSGLVTLVYGSKEERFNNAVVLEEFLRTTLK